MKVKTKISILILCLIFTSCNIYHNMTRQNFKLCYEGLDTGLDTLIDIKGYYPMDVTYSDGSSLNNCKVVFYKDGMFLHNPQLNNISDFGLDYTKVGKYWDWGIYKLSNDTIIGQFLNVSGATSSCESVFYKIIDSHTIQRIYPQSRNNKIIDDVYDYRSLYHYKFSYSSASFVPFKELPSPDNSLAKSKRWFWCEKAEYKKWKKSQ